MTQKGNVGVKRFNRNWQDGNPYVKSKNGVWTRPNSIFVKQNGEWVNTTKTESFYDGVIKYSAICDTVDNTYWNIPAATYGDNRTAKWAFSTWIKRTNYFTTRQMIWGYVLNGSNISWLEFDTVSRLWIRNYIGGDTDSLLTSMKFHDTSNWYHIYFENDVAQATASERWRLWVNGHRIRDFDTENYPLQDDVTNTYYFKGDTFAERISTYDTASYDMSAYIADMHVIHGACPGVGQFGRFRRGVWIPQRYEGSHGAYGFHLDFSDSSDLGKDVSGNEHHFTTANITSANQSIDTPENNWCTFNERATAVSMSENKDGALNIGYSTTAWLCAGATWAINKGKWYWEGKATTDVYYGGGGLIASEYSSDLTTVASHFPAAGGAGYCWVMLQGFDPVRFYTTAASYKNSTNLTGTPAVGDTMMFAFDADNNKFWVGRNGVWGLDTSRVSNPDPASGSYPMWDYDDGIDTSKFDYIPYGTVYQAYDLVFNFGQNDYDYEPPTGFKRLRSKNLDEPTIEIPKKYFDVTTWTGYFDDASRKQIIGPPSGNGLDFSPDFVWLKDRDTSTAWGMFDVRRGPKRYVTNEDVDVETNEVSSVYGYLSSFDERGFTVSGGTTNQYLTHYPGDDYVAWCWKIGADFGIDIVLYDGTGTAQNISHDLGQTPKMIMIKDRLNVYNWTVYHFGGLNKTDPETDFGVLNLTNTWSDLNTVWNDTAPTDTQFTVGTVGNVNEADSEYIAYLFADIPGFCKVFAYEGNGNADGPYVYLGFKPRFVLVKNIDTTHNWVIFDTKRDTYSPFRTYLRPNLVNAEGTTAIYDINSNGIKSIETSNNLNGYTYIGVAFAEHPFKYSNAGHP